MRLLVTYVDGRTETYTSVEIIEPIKDANGKTVAIYGERWGNNFRLERPSHSSRGIKSMELFFGGA